MCYVDIYVWKDSMFLVKVQKSWIQLSLGANQTENTFGRHKHLLPVVFYGSKSFAFC